jgi:hypothetical protein
MQLLLLLLLLHSVQALGLRHPASACACALAPAVCHMFPCLG